MRPACDKASWVCEKSSPTTAWGTRRNRETLIDYHVARFLNVYCEGGLTENNKPAWRYMVWWALPGQRQP
jgi:hypothetical protein